METLLTCQNLQGYFSHMQIKLHQFHAAGVPPLKRWRLPLRKLNDRSARGGAHACRNFIALLERSQSGDADIGYRLSGCVDADLASSR